MYRDNLEAAHMRITELEKENKRLERNIGKYIQQGICPKCSYMLDRVPEKKIICKVCDKELWWQDLELYKNGATPTLCQNCWFCICRTLPTALPKLSILDIISITYEPKTKIYYAHRKDGFSYAVSSKQINNFPKIKWEKAKQRGKIC